MYFIFKWNRKLPLIPATPSWKASEKFSHFCFITVTLLFTFLLYYCDPSFYDCFYCWTIMDISASGIINSYSAAVNSSAHFLSTSVLCKHRAQKTATLNLNLDLSSSVWNTLINLWPVFLNFEGMQFFAKCTPTNLYSANHWFSCDKAMYAILHWSFSIYRELSSKGLSSNFASDLSELNNLYSLWLTITFSL